MEFIKNLSEPGIIFPVLVILTSLIYLAVCVRYHTFLVNYAKKLQEGYAELIEKEKQFGDEDVDLEDINQAYFVSGPEAHCFVTGKSNIEPAITVMCDMTGDDEDDYTATKVNLRDTITLHDGFIQTTVAKADATVVLKPPVRSFFNIGDKQPHAIRE